LNVRARRISNCVARSDHCCRLPVRQLVFRTSRGSQAFGSVARRGAITFTARCAVSSATTRPFGAGQPALPTRAAGSKRRETSLPAAFSATFSDRGSSASCCSSAPRSTARCEALEPGSADVDGVIADRVRRTNSSPVWYLRSYIDTFRAARNLGEPHLPRARSPRRLQGSFRGRSRVLLERRARVQWVCRAARSFEGPSHAT